MNDSVTSSWSGDSACNSESVTRARDVSVLFARADSCYFELVGDVWDFARDARGYAGGNAVIAHPPCRGWGRLSHMSVATEDEKALGLFAVEQVRRCGGVLEHPWASKLWRAAGLPAPAQGVDAWGGYTLLLDQGWFGHAAPKPTWLYVCGCDRGDVPVLPVKAKRATGRTLDLPVAQREATPIEFAKFLVAVAAMCKAPGQCNGDSVTSTWCAPAVCNSGPVTRGQGRRNSFLDVSDLMIG